VSRPLAGAPLDRVEGPAKVTGQALYTADYDRDALAAVVVTSTIASGRIVAIDDECARGSAGVVEVMTHRNAPRVEARKASQHGSHLFLLQDTNVEFDGQPVAVAIAQTFEQATHAAALVRLEYRAQRPEMDLAAAPRFVPQEIFGEPADGRRGDPAAALAAAPVRIDRTYRTPTEHHNPLESHATIARWDGDRLTLVDSSQWAFGVRDRIAAIFGLPASGVRVIVPYVGGGFGSKGQPWSHVALAAMAAKLVGRPVKLVVTRPQMFAWIGHRPQTEQRIALGAERDGRLVSVVHDVLSETSVSDEYVEPCGVFSRDLYRVPNYAMSHALARLHIAKPTFARGPGESTGSFAMESAMDELAYELGMDPLELRLRNFSERDPYSGKPYTSNHLRECYELGAQRFGWERRNPQPRSTRNGATSIGLGMAAASRGTFRSEARVRIAMHEDGTVVLQSGTIEMGCGSPTVYAQLAAEILEIPFERVRFEFGDTELPYAPLAAGSQTSGSVGSAVVVASRRLRDELSSRGGRVPSGGIALDVTEGPGDEEERFAMQTFGAQFAEVEVDCDLGAVRVTRFVGAFDCGRILNAKTARSQLLGGIVWGISMALFEKTRYDLRTGRITNANLAEYLVPTNADVPVPEIVVLENDDVHVNPAGVKGIGEIAITGVAAAVANAVYHATGVRVRELPIVAESLLD